MPPPSGAITRTMARRSSKALVPSICYQRPCATLGAVKVPTLVVGGEQSPLYFSLINEVVVQCIPGSRLEIIPKATHLMSSQNPVVFNEALLQFRAQH